MHLNYKTIIDLLSENYTKQVKVTDGAAQLNIIFPICIGYHWRLLQIIQHEFDE